MLQIVVHRVLDNPAVSVRFERDPALCQAFPGFAYPGRFDVAYVMADRWPHPGDPADLADLCHRALDLGAGRMAAWGGWQGLV